LAIGSDDLSVEWACGSGAKGESQGPRVLFWDNPHEDKTLAALTFSTNLPYTSPTLLGLTVLDSAEKK